MIDFDAQKQKYLRELGSATRDRSKKGHVDEEIISLLDAINRDPEFYTTSSCAGRIDLFREPVSGKKHEGEWLYVTHDEAFYSDMMDVLRNLPAETVWFRMEGAILHVCCRTMEAANRFLQACRDAGWKHSGITGTEKRIIVEAMTPERVDVPISKDSVLFVPERFVEYLIKEANDKLRKTREKMGRLEQAIMKSYGHGVS